MDFENKYKKLLKDVLASPIIRQNRTETTTISKFGICFRHNLQNGFPLLTSKKMFLKNFISELIWIVNGETNIKYLQDNKVRIWDQWADANGELGPVYGYQLRKFNG